MWSWPSLTPDAPYEIIKERSAAEYIPLGMELTIDGRRMKIDSVDFQAGTVSLLDLDMKGWFPISRSEPIPFVRDFVEEAQRGKGYTITEMAAHLQRLEAADEIPIGMELTVDGRRVKIDSVDTKHDIVRLKILDLAYPSCVRSWEENWEVLNTFYEYLSVVRKIIYIENIIEGLNRQFRQIRKNNPSFTNDDSLCRMRYLASRRITKRWRIR